ncbi:MAG: hypothetical protein P4N59_31010, partial [Negativicutes bacterium]|nr:hypothetical protein [Negativicutes bacterium]
VGQDALEQFERLKRLAQVMAQCREKTELADFGVLQVMPGAGELVGQLIELRKVGEGNNNARRLVPGHRVRGCSASITQVIARGYFPFYRAAVIQDASCICENIVAQPFRTEVCQRPADVALDNIQQSFGRGGEKQNIEVRIQNNSGHCNEA